VKSHSDRISGKGEEKEKREELEDEMVMKVKEEDTNSREPEERQKGAEEKSNGLSIDSPCIPTEVRERIPRRRETREKEIFSLKGREKLEEKRDKEEPEEERREGTSASERLEEEENRILSIVNLPSFKREEEG
jgi:hypothetical protein